MSVNDYPHKVGWCKECNQGWLVIAKTVETQKLFIGCGECYSGHNTPQDMIERKCQHNNSHHTGRWQPPSTEEVNVAGWSSFVMDMDKWKNGEVEAPVY